MKEEEEQEEAIAKEEKCTRIFSCLVELKVTELGNGCQMTSANLGDGLTIILPL